MARKVFVSNDMSVDERVIAVAEQNSQAALIWPWILTAFDDWGRSNADPKRLKASVFPAIESVTPELIEAALSLYADVGLIILYEQQGKPYMAIPVEKWFKYQTHIRSEKRTKDSSRHPAPPSEIGGDSATLRASARSVAQVLAVRNDSQPSPSPSPSRTPTAATAAPKVVSTTATATGEPDSIAAAAVDGKATETGGQASSSVEPLGARQVVDHIARKLVITPEQISGRDMHDIRDDCARHGPRVVIRAVDLACESQLEKGRHKRGDPRLGPDIRSYQFCREFLNQAKELVEEQEAIERDREIGARRKAETQALLDELLAAAGDRGG